MPDPWLPLELERHGGDILPCLLHRRGNEAGSAVVPTGVREAAVVDAVRESSARAFVIVGRAREGR